MSHKGNELVNNHVKIKSLLHAVGMKCFLVTCLAVFLKQELKRIICKNKSEAWSITEHSFLPNRSDCVYLSKSSL